MNFSNLSKLMKLGLCLFLILPTVVQAQLSLDAQFRPRAEYRNGYRLLRTPGTQPAFFTSQRARLNLNYRSDVYRIRFSAQDVRVWGEVDQLQDNPNVNIHEAWAELYLTDRWQLKLGRQELIYNDHRLLGSVNWTQQARSHDALLVKYRDSSASLAVDLGAAYNQNAENILGNTYTLNNYKVLSYLWLNKHFGALNASALALADGFEIPTGSVNYRYTYGTHLAYGTGDLDLAGTAYLQNGDDLTRNDINAYMFAGKASYAFGGTRLTAGYDYLSGGDSDDANPARHAFNTLYATNHKFYGHMDYFLNVPVDTRGGGLQDLYLSGNFDLSEKTVLGITYHYFMLAGKIADPLNPGQRLDKGLGSEVDLSLSYAFTEDITLKLGASTLFNTTSLNHIQQRAGAEDMQHWGWAMLVLTPELISP